MGGRPCVKCVRLDADILKAPALRPQLHEDCAVRGCSTRASVGRVGVKRSGAPYRDQRAASFSQFSLPEPLLGLDTSLALARLYSTGVASLDFKRTLSKCLG